MANVTISFNTRRPMGLTKSRVVGSEAGRYLSNALTAALNSSAGGSGSDGCLWTVNDNTAFGNEPNAGSASAGIVLSSASGAVGATIDGTLVTAAAAGGDANTAGLVAAAIRANASVNRKVTATNRGMGMLLTGVTVGQFVDVCGQTFTGVNGTPTDFGQFDISGSDTADAASLALAINRHPSLAMKVCAINNANAVYVFPSTDRVVGKYDVLNNRGGFSTISVPSPTQGPLSVCCVIANVPGAIGECCTIVASGTGAAVATANAGKLGGGTGGGASPNYFLP